MDSKTNYGVVNAAKSAIKRQIVGRRRRAMLPMSDNTKYGANSYKNTNGNVFVIGHGTDCMTVRNNVWFQLLQDVQTHFWSQQMALKIVDTNNPTLP